MGKNSENLGGKIEKAKKNIENLQKT